MRQNQPLGLGHALLCARHLVGDEPFAVLLPDDLMQARRPVLAQMIQQYQILEGAWSRSSGLHVRTRRSME